jgi:serine/threonine-protein kinase
MAPEQAFGDDVVDHRADIWALGLILYQCLTGILPTDAKNVGQIFKILLTRRIWPLRDLNPTVPADLASMVDRMLAREVKKRPVDLGEVLAVLKTHSRTSTPNFGSVATDNKSNVVSGEWNNVDVIASIESVAPRPSRRSRIPRAHAVVGFGFAGGALATVLAASIGLLHSAPAPAPELASVRVTPEEHRTAPPVETPSEVAARIVGEPAPASAALVVPSEERPLPQKHSGGRRRADGTSRSASGPTETAPPPGASTPDRARTPQGSGLAIELDNPYEHK